MITAAAPPPIRTGLTGLSTQEVLPSVGWCCPEEHFVSTDEPGDSTKNPVGATMHADWPVSGWYVPSKQIDCSIEASVST